MSIAPAASASGAGWRQNLGHALMATVLTAIVVTPIFGLHLERAGVRTHIVPRWDMVGWACLIVFVVQLLHPWIFGRATRRLPRLALPALSARQNTVLLTLVLLVAVTWPFFAGRNAVDIATLA
jgi:branched-chain amino acid transport system permease protein